MDSYDDDTIFNYYQFIIDTSEMDIDKLTSLYEEICEVEEYSGLDDYEGGIYEDYTIENMLLSIIVKKKREELDIDLTEILESNYSIYETTRIISTNEDFYSLIIDYTNELIDKEYIYYELKDTYLRRYLDKSDIVKTREKYENKSTELPIANPEQRFNVGRLVFRFTNVYKYCLHVDRLYLRQECRNTKARLFLGLWHQYKIADDGDKYLCKLEKRRSKGKKLLRSFLDVAQLALDQGGHVSFERPRDCTGWLLPPLIKVIHKNTFTL